MAVPPKRRFAEVLRYSVGSGPDPAPFRRLLPELSEAHLLLQGCGCPCCSRRPRPGRSRRSASRWRHLLRPWRAEGLWLVRRVWTEGHDGIRRHGIGLFTRLAAIAII